MKKKKRNKLKKEIKDKVEHSKEVIRCWADSFGSENMYVAFSGGKDSTVLMHIVRSLYPEVTGVFNNTGLELPEIVKFVRTFNNIVELRPKIPFHQVIEKYGWPAISKEQAQFINEYRNTKSDKLRELRWNGRANGRSKISEKWKFAVNAPFKISHQCCNKLKKEPAKRYEKQSGKHPMLGIMASESALRKQNHNCNIYDSKRPISRPLLHWTEADIWKYIKAYKVNYCCVYDQGWDRTGCVFCMFGIHYHKPNRFQMIRKTHPKLYKYCMKKLGVKKVLKFFSIPRK